MDGISKKTGLLMITMFVLILSVISVSAQPAQPESYSGIAYIGDVVAPSGTSVRATTTHYNGSSVTYSTTTNGSGYYTLDIPVGNSDFPTGANATASITWYIGATAATACGSATPPTGSCSDVVTSNQQNTNWNLKIDASCTDGVLNQGEALIDCGGTSSCGSCLSATSSISLSADASESAQNATGTLTASSGSTSSYTPNIAVTLAATSLINTANASDTISMSLSSSALLLRSGSSNSSTITVTIPANKSAGTYTGNISVYNTAGLSNSTVPVTLTISEAGVGVIRARRYMALTVSPVAATEFCVNQPVSIYTNDTTTGRALSDVHLDAIYNGAKIFILATDSVGKATFTPNKVGIWNVTASLHRYRDTEKVVNVKSCVVTTTTLKPAVTTTTVKPAVTTTTVQPVVTTTVPKPPVTTTALPPVTTTVPPAPPAPAVPSWLIWVVVIIVIIVIIYLVTKKGKSGETPEAK